MVVMQNCRMCVCVCVFMCASMCAAISCESSAHLPSSPPPRSFCLFFASSAALLPMCCSGQFTVNSPRLSSPFSPPFLHAPVSLCFIWAQKNLKDTLIILNLKHSKALTYTSPPCAFLLTLLACLISPAITCYHFFEDVFVSEFNLFM